MLEPPRNRSRQLELPALHERGYLAIWRSQITVVEYENTGQFLNGSRKVRHGARETLNQFLGGHIVPAL
jgi:hypothetical protein